MTNQEVFDKVWRHFVIENNPKSILRDVDGRETCQYRGKDGAKCAIGILIADSEYSEEIEGLPILPLLESNHSCVKHLQGTDRHFLRRLQTEHDATPSGGDFHKTLKVELEHVAKDFNLEYGHLS